MITYLINQAILAGFNWGNTRIDAYRILRHKGIAHGINFGTYAVFTLILYYFTVKPVFTWSAFPYADLVVYLFAAFTNRQFSFDIPLNLRRGLKWDYVTKANPPKSILDRIEIRIFGRNGKAPFVMYGLIWIACLIIKFFL
jgi:hypothetical protein